MVERRNIYPRKTASQNESHASVIILLVARSVYNVTER